MARRTLGELGTAALRKGMRSVRYSAAPIWRSIARDCPPSPPNLELDVTDRCNMACRHCFASPQYGPELSLDEIAVLANDINPVTSLSLGGGEPFLREDLPEICALFSRRNPGLSIAVTTNGFNAEKICTTARAVLERSPQAGLWVILSLDGFRDTHDEIRQTAGAFDRSIATARGLGELTHESSRLGFGFNATMTNLNWRELPSLSKHLRTEFGVGLGCNLLSGTPRDSSLRLPATKDVRRTLSDMARLESDSSAAYLKVFNSYRLAALKSGRQVVPCVAGSFYGTVTANGDVRACALLPPLGNLRDAPFQSIWNGPLAAQQRESIRHGECACHTDCYLRTSMAYYWKVPLSVYQARIAGLIERTERN